MKLSELVQIVENTEVSINESMKKAISDMTSKGKKYVTMKALQQHMGKSDAEFKKMTLSAFKSNRHSNNYIFTTVGEEPAVGITAMKRKKKASAIVGPEPVEKEEPTVEPEAPEDNEDITEPDGIE